MEEFWHMQRLGFHIEEARDLILADAAFYWLNPRTGERREVSEEYGQALLASE
jgi:hypothetical protein